jgi:dihydrofolate reductase
MRKIIVLSFMSLDGVIQAPGGPDEDTTSGFEFGGWVFPYFDEEGGKIMAQQMNKQSDLLLGRKTFEIFAFYWPQHADGWPGINKVTKYVASRSPLKSEWENSVHLEGDVVAALNRLKRQDGTDLQVHGIGNLIQTLLKNDLVDELWLKIFPLTLGNGKRLFETGAIPANFKLIESTATTGGVIFASYARDGAVKTGSFV